MHEDTLFGADPAKVQSAELAVKHGYEVAVNIAYRARTTNLDAEVRSCRQPPTCSCWTSYTSNAFLFVKTAKPGSAALSSSSIAQNG